MNCYTLTMHLERGICNMVEVRICVGTSCHLNGSYNVVQSIQQLIEEKSIHEKINVEACFCMKECQAKGVSVTIDGQKFRIIPEEIGVFFQENIMPRIGC